MPVLIKDDIERLIGMRRGALLDADADALARLLHPHYRYIDSLGRLLPREAYLASRRSREVEFDRHEITELEVRELESPRAALATCRIHDIGRYLGERFEARYHAVHICIRAGDDWLFLFGQSTAIAASGS